MGEVCSDRCERWVDWESKGDFQMPFWAEDYILVQGDTYPIVTALGRQHGVQTRVHLTMGYNFVLEDSLFGIIPYRRMVRDDNHDLRNFSAANEEPHSWYGVWEARERE